MEFEVGDEVKCIDSVEYIKKKLIKGEIYTITKIIGRHVCVDGIDCSFCTTRFIKEPKKEKDTEAGQNKSLRFNSGKAEFFDAPLLGLIEVAKVAAYGRSKYSKYNWKKGTDASQYHDCRMRHEMKYWYGQDIDSESKCLHLAHIAWNALAAIEVTLTGKINDDRHKGSQEFIDNIEKLFALNDDQKAAIQVHLDIRDKNE